MIQELLGGSNVGLIGEILDGSPSQPPPPPSSSPTAAAATATTTAAAVEILRCPRCDSANTKFCYYNNYNLTQPRHFCKTCRRYWTKGGALRNVPIGGGCRKNKSTGISVGKPSTTATATTATKLMKTVTQEIIIGKSPLFSGLDHSHFLSLPRPNPNPNFFPNSISGKKEGLSFGQSYWSSDSPILNTGFNSRVPGLDMDPLPQFQASPMGLAYRNQSEPHNIHELYQRLRSSTNCYPEVGNNSTVLESAPVAITGEMGFWNPNLPWSSDLPN